MPHPPALIVEDDFLIALDLERILMERGHEVVGIAADCEEAMAHAGACRVAFVDVNLRDGCTGPELGEALARDHGVKVVFVTGNPEQLGARRDLAVTCVTKPFCDRIIIDAAAQAEGQAQG